MHQKFIIFKKLRLKIYKFNNDQKTCDLICMAAHKATFCF